MTEFEPFLEKRILKARQRASAIADGEVLTDDDFRNRIVSQVASYYKIPFFDSRWLDYTLDDLLVEYYLIVEKNKTGDQVTSEVIKESREDLEDLFEGLPGFGETPMDLNPPELTENEKEFIAMFSPKREDEND